MVSEPLTIHELSYNHWQMVMCRSLARPFCWSKINAMPLWRFCWHVHDQKPVGNINRRMITGVVVFNPKGGHEHLCQTFMKNIPSLWISHISSIIQPCPSAVQTAAELSAPLCLWLTSEPSNRISSCFVILQLSTGQPCLVVMHIAYACVLYCI